MTYPSSHRWTEERIGAVAVYCSDGRWGNAVDEFCIQGLALPRYDRFVVPGGPAWLTLRDARLLTPYDVARQNIHFLVEAHGLRRAVLIGHYGCAFYAELLGLPPDELLPHQEADLREGARTLRGWLAGLEVEAYMARREGERIWFEALALP